MASRAVVTVFCLSWTLSAAAQGPEAAGVRGESGSARRQLAEAEQLLKSNKPGDARKLLAKILDESGDDLILVEGGRYVATRWYTQRLLARLPEDELKLFRAGIDDAANILLEDSRSRRDPQPLQELIERYFVSSVPAEALILLGELAFERGEFELAESYWARLLTEEDRPPGPIANLSTIAARRILAVLFQNEAERVGKLFQEFSQTHANAKGRLAGRDGILADTLREELQRLRKPQSTLSSASDWSTLGGSAQRTGFVPGSLGQLPIAPLWSVPIPGRSEGGPVVNAVRRVGFHPILDGHHVYIADPHRIHRFDLADGKLNTLYDGAHKGQPNASSQWQNADFTLTQAHGRVYARLGEAGVLPGDSNRKNAMASRIVGVPANSKLQPRIITPPVGDDAIAGWEGAPLAVDGKLLAAFTRLDGGRLVQAIACYDDRNAKPLWVTDVCEAAVVEAEGRERQELLTGAGPNIVFCSQSGVIAAVNRRTGKPAWSYRYQRIAKSSFDGRPRDLSPPVAAGSRVFVAPNDSDKLFAFDAESGRLLWQTGPILIDHLIGVAEGKVIAAIAGPQRGLRAYHAATGSCDLPYGWMQHDDPMLATFGRGLIAGKHIAWPTQAGLYLIHLEDGLPARPLLRDVHGNLAYADGKLAVADAKTLSLFAWPAAGSMQPAGKALTKGDFSPRRVNYLLNTYLKFVDYSIVPVRHELRLFEEREPSIEIERSSNVNEFHLIPKARSGIRIKERFFSFSNQAADEVEYAGLSSVVARGSELSACAGGTPILLIDLRAPVRRITISERGLIVAKLGDHTLAGIDGSTLQVRWLLDSNKRDSLRLHSISSAPRFDDSLYSDKQFVMARLNSGVCWLIHAETGKIEGEWPATAEWTTQPVKIGGSQVVFAAGPGSFRCIELKDKSTAWTYETANSAGQTGAAPQLRFDNWWTNRIPIKHNINLFALITRNHGVELECLLFDGTNRWKQPAPLGTSPVSLIDADCLADTIFVPATDKILAVDRSNGAILWECPLEPGYRWIVHAFKDAIVLVPQSTFRIKWKQFLSGPVRFLLNLMEPEQTRILFLDPGNGEIKQTGRVNGPILTSFHNKDGIWLTAPQAVYRVKPFGTKR